MYQTIIEDEVKLIMTKAITLIGSIRDSNGNHIGVNPISEIKKYLIKYEEE